MEIIQTAKFTQDEALAMQHIAGINCQELKGCENCPLHVSDNHCVRNDIRRILNYHHYAYEE